MGEKRIIPCLDIKDGRVVKGINFFGLKDAGDPVLLAKKYSEEKADEIVFLDITATVEKRDFLFDIIKKAKKELAIPFTVGGGIKTIDNIKNLIEFGANKVSIGSAALSDKTLIKKGADLFGSKSIVLAIDAKKTGDNKWEVFTNGGRVATGVDPADFAKEGEQLGAGEILLTSMDGDGTKNGYDLLLTKKVAENIGIPVIASGGAGKIEDFYDAVTIGQADAVLAASVFHYGQFTISEVKNYLKERGVQVK